MATGPRRPFGCETSKENFYRQVVDIAKSHIAKFQDICSKVDRSGSRRHLCRRGFGLGYRWRVQRLRQASLSVHLLPIVSCSDSVALYFIQTNHTISDGLRPIYRTNKYNSIITRIKLLFFT